MTLFNPLNSRILLCMLAVSVLSVQAAKFAELQAVDKNYLMIHFLDGEVIHRDDGLGTGAFANSHHEDDGDTVKLYNPLLSTSAAQSASNWTLKSSDDPVFGSNGLNPAKCYRKTKMNGQAEEEWQSSDYKYEYTYEHYIFLKFNESLKQGCTYTLDINPLTNSDKTSGGFIYDIYQCRSEAVHVNLAGYHPDPTMKSADLYIWMGDGGARDYKDFAGNKVYVYDVDSKAATEAGTVTLWKTGGDDVGWFNLIRSTVWNADFSGFTTPGTYRLAVDGIGCSQDFTIAENAYYLPFMVSTQGFFYMRVGQDSTGGISPVPRRPLYIPGKSPSGTKVYLTTMNQYHSNWKTFSSGDVWDRPDDWADYRKSGNPTNDNAWGGHADALDWDRHLGHIAIIYDMLLPFILTNGVINDDNLGIAESGNGIPDILDEARNEVDFWLRLRDGAAYSHGLTNPNDNDEFFQAAPSAVAAWANAANAAMLADCFRIAKIANLMNEYRDSAVAAYTYASGLADQMLDSIQGSGETYFRGRDLKMTAAAALYNITGEKSYEDDVFDECEIKGTNSQFEDYNDGDSKNQLYAAALYLMTQQTVNYSTMFSNMKASVIAQAKLKEADYSGSRPSRRSTHVNTGYFRATQNVQHTMIAHAVAGSQSDKFIFRKALVLEADYGLGRNPLNMIQMTTAGTPLESKRSVIDAYTTGGDDGVAGMHPGHTPYFNLDDWACDMTMGCPSKLYANAYPADFNSTWPVDEGYFNTRYSWAHNEFTPQQTMRGKMALYGYLYGLSKSSTRIAGQYFRNAPDRSSKAIAVLNDEPLRIIDLAGRVVWSGIAGSNIKSIYQKLPAHGVYFLERLNAHGRVARISVVNR